MPKISVSPILLSKIAIMFPDSKQHPEEDDCFVSEDYSITFHSSNEDSTRYLEILFKLRNLSCAVELCGYIEEDNHLAIFTRKFKGLYLSEYKDKFTIDDTLVNRILLAFKSIHDRGIIHGSIDDESICITPEHEVKLVGFDDSRILTKEADTKEDYWFLGLVLSDTLSSNGQEVSSYQREVLTKLLDESIKEISFP